MEINLTSAVDLCRVRRQGKGRARDAQSPVGNLNSAITATLAAGIHTVKAATLLAQTGDFTLPVWPQEWSVDRGMLRDGVARNGVTPGLALPVIGHSV